jgi:DNA-binding transcriptional MerR regulator
MKTLYSPTAAARLLNLNPARLQRWLNYGHFRPEYRALLGDVEARLLTEEEVERLKTVMDLINGGVPVQKAFAQMSLETSQSVEQ